MRTGAPVTVTFSKPKIVLGRADTCEVNFPEIVKVSRQHATIQREGETWTISDLNSRNGTYVNKARVTRHRLHDEDVIHIGPVRLVFRLEPTGPVADRVVFDDEPASGTTSTIINMDEVQKLLEGKLKVRPAQTSSAIPNTVSPSAPLSEQTGFAPSVAAVASDAWIVALFSQAGRVLLSSDDLHEMFEQVLDLVFSNLPVQRGVVCLVDNRTAAMVPKVMRSRQGELGEIIRISRSISNEVMTRRKSLLVNNLQSDTRFSMESSMSLREVRAVMCAPLYHEGNVFGLIYVDSLTSQQPFSEQHLEVLTALAVLSAVGVQQARLRAEVQREQLIRARLARYHSPRVVDRVIDSSDRLVDEMVAEEKEVSVIFADLNNFTTMSEKMTPVEVAQVLNEIFERLTDTIFLLDGTLDKYIGDAIMALFGAPIPQPDHARRAVEAALAMQTEVEAFNQTHPDRPPIRIRIGINSGPVVAGDIGSPKRKDYTVIGDTVNVASRLESSVAKPGQVVIGSETYEKVRGLFECKPLEVVRVKGREQALQPYLVVGTIVSPGGDSAARSNATLVDGSSPI